MSLEISVLSQVLVKVPIVARKHGLPVDPTADTVQLAFTLAFAAPGSGDWVTGSWETAGTVYYARALVGPAGNIVLPLGSYTVWVKITDNPEVPVLNAGTLIIS